MHGAESTDGSGGCSTRPLASEHRHRHPREDQPEGDQVRPSQALPRHEDREAPEDRQRDPLLDDLELRGGELPAVVDVPHATGRTRRKYSGSAISQKIAIAVKIPHPFRLRW